MANLIQIKRSLTNATPSGLANGELAFTANGDILFIGSNSSTIAIAGKRTPGTLTANQALVANATGYLDTIKAQNAWIGSVYANGSIGTAGQVLVSNGSIVYWGTGTAGSDTYVQFNDHGEANGTGGFTFNKTSNNLLVANTINTLYVNARSISIFDIEISNSSYGANGYFNNLTGANLVSNSISANVITTYNIEISNSSYGANGYFNKLTGANLVSNSITADSANIGSLNNVSVNNYVQYNDSRDLTGNLIFNGANLVVNGTFLNISSNVNYTGKISSNFIPSVNNSYDLGSTNYKWRTGYFETGIQLNTVSLQDNSGSLGVNNIIVYTDAKIANIVGTTTNISSNLNISSNTIYANYAFLSVSTANVANDLYVGGDLHITGNISSSNVSTLNVQDPVIHLAANNEASDLLDIGFVGHYYDGSSLHAGIIRDATTKEFYTFTNWPYEPGITADIFDTTNNDFHIAYLNTYLRSGGLVSNATNFVLTSNSSLNVGITANTLALNTPLPTSSGGTGYNTYTSQDILVANASNGLAKLSLGTDGTVLQSNGSALIYATLDGGTF